MPIAPSQPLQYQLRYPASYLFSSPHQQPPKSALRSPNCPKLPPSAPASVARPSPLGSYPSATLIHPTASAGTFRSTRTSTSISISFGSTSLRPTSKSSALSGPSLSPCTSAPPNATSPSSQSTSPPIAASTSSLTAAASPVGLDLVPELYRSPPPPPARAQGHLPARDRSPLCPPTLPSSGSSLVEVNHKPEGQLSRLPAIL